MPTASRNPETERYYLTQAALGGFVASQVAAAPVDLDPLNLAETFADLRTVAAGIGAEFALSAIGDAVDYYEDFRYAQGVRDRFRVPLIEVPTEAEIEAAIREATAELFDAVEVVADELYLAQLTLQLQAEAEAITRDAVVNAGRDQVFEAMFADALTTRWVRVTRTGACSFCRMLAARGPVYKGKTVKFRAHTVINGRGGVCQCTAEPLIRGSYKPTSQQVADEALWKQVADDGFTGAEARNEFRRRIEGRAGGRRMTPAASPTRKPVEIQAQKGGFLNLTPAQLELHLSVLEPLKDSEYRTQQMARIRARLAELA